MYGLGLDGYDPDSQHDAAVAFRIRVVAQEQYIPLHQHRKGQLIMALGGAITCEVENAMLMVPPSMRCGYRVKRRTATRRRPARSSACCLLNPVRSNYRSVPVR